MQINFFCEYEGNGTMHVLSAYLTYTDHFIQTSNLIIGIRLGNNNLTLNLEQETKPKVTIESMLNSTTSVKLIEDVNGTLIISLGLIKRFCGPVSELINITSSKDSRPYLIKHYVVSNMTICTEKNLACEYKVIDDDIVKTRKVQLKENVKHKHLHLRDLTILSTNLEMGIFLGNKIFTLNIEQEKRPIALAITLQKMTNYNKWKDSTPSLAKKITAITWLKQINGTLTIYLGRTEIFRKHADPEMEILSRNSPSYFIQHNGIQWLKVGQRMNQNPNIIICRRSKLSLYYSCEKEDGFIKNIIAENVTSYIQKYLNHTDHYIQTSNLVIGIRLGNENLSLSIEQNTKPKINTTGAMLNSTNKLIKDVNGTLIISLGMVKRFSGPISESINITSSKGSRLYLIKHKVLRSIVNSTTVSIINSTIFQKRIEDVNGTLIITLGRDKIFHGPVTKSIRITSSKDAVPFLVKHNGINVTRKEK